MIDEGGNETGRREQRIALQVDDQVDVAERFQRLGAALGSIAAAFRRHDHRCAEAFSRRADAFVVGDDMDLIHARNPACRFETSLD